MQKAHAASRPIFDGESLPNVSRLPAVESRNLFAKTLADRVAGECEQETHKISIGKRGGGEEFRGDTILEESRFTIPVLGESCH